MKYTNEKLERLIIYLEDTVTNFDLIHPEGDVLIDRAKRLEEFQRTLDLTQEIVSLRAALVELSCLGNGDKPGNSIGNEIAIRALAR